jgi:hypothetical protein
MQPKPNRSNLIWLILLTGVTAVLIALMVLSNKEPPPLPEPTSTPVSPTSTPATQDEAIRNGVEEALRYIVTFQGGDDPALTLPFVSTGEFASLTFDLDGQPVTADIVYAYTVNAVRELLIVPVAIGAVFPDSVYRSFDVLVYGKPVDAAGKQALKEKLGRGTAFKANIFDFVDPGHKSADWQRCNLTPIVCAAAAQLADPGLEMALVLKTVQEIPPDWALFGWSINANNPPDEAPWRAEIP